MPETLFSDPAPSLKGRDILFVDTTLRDGEQTPGVAYDEKQKLEIVRLLDDAGVPMISVGYPAVSQEERAIVSAIVAAKERGELRSRISVLSRPLRSDIDCALDCGVEAVSLFLPTSDIHLDAKFGPGGRAKVLRTLEEGASYAASRRLPFGFAAEDSVRTDFGYLVSVFRRALELGAENLYVCDTVGLLPPERTYALVRDLLRELPGARLLMHCHNDFGLATANTVAGILAGAAGASVTVNGIGERAGNAPLEELAMILKHIYDCDCGLKTELFAPLSDLVQRHSGIAIDAFKPITGKHAFTHESGIHVSALLKDPRTYHPFPPEEVGRRCEFVIGKHSGKAVLRSLLADAGVTISEDEAEALLARIKRDPNLRGRPVDAREIKAFFESAAGPRGWAAGPRGWAAGAKA